MDIKNMKLPLSDANRVIDLLDCLDAFAIETLNIFKKGEVVVFDDEHEPRAIVRRRWQTEADFIDKFIKAHCDLSESDVQLLESWKNCHAKKYLFITCCKEYAVFYSLDDRKFYGVLGLTENMNEMISYEPPMALETTLLPYEGYIVWDGLIGVHDLSFGKNIEAVFERDYKQAKKDGKICTQL